MILSLTQPQFAPNLYDLIAMLRADRVILLDEDRWSRKGRTHRALIRNKKGTQWINLPVVQQDRKRAINCVRIDHSEDWFHPFWNAILHNYHRSTWFDYFQDELKASIKEAETYDKLIDFNIYLFQKLLLFLELDIKFELASTVTRFNPIPDITDSNLYVDKLYLEHQSKNYMRQNSRAEVALKEHPIYRQAHSGFMPSCSILDLLMNEGKESFRVIENL